MRKTVENVADTVSDSGQLRASDTQGFRVGRIVSINPQGRPLVDFPGNSLGPLEARTLLARVNSNGDSEDGVPVLLAFDAGDPTLPVIVGELRNTLQVSASTRASVPPREELPKVTVDGKTLVFDASEQITLRCGKSSLLLRRDGKIIVKGTDIVTRAARTNKIRGGTVMIN